MHDTKKGVAAVKAKISAVCGAFKDVLKIMRGEWLAVAGLLGISAIGSLVIAGYDLSVASPEWPADAQYWALLRFAAAWTALWAVPYVLLRTVLYAGVLAAERIRVPHTAVQAG